LVLELMLVLVLVLAQGCQFHHGAIRAARVAAQLPAAAVRAGHAPHSRTVQHEIHLARPWLSQWAGWQHQAVTDAALVKNTNLDVTL
jgi:hypothetical protein